MKKELRVQDLIVGIGEKKQGFINILDTKESMPITLINGEKGGKTLLITAGIHGGEYPAIKSAIELAKEIDPKEVSGQIIILHIANLQGFVERAAAVVPEDNKNILRLFPGNAKGTISEKIAYTITNELQELADYYLDIHGGDIHEDLLPHIYYPAKAEDKVVEESVNMAKCCSVNYFVKSNSVNGTYTSAAVNKRIPSLLIERGGCGLCKEDDVKNYKNDILNVLNYLDILKRENVTQNIIPSEINNAVYLDALNDGCWTCFVNAGDEIVKGQKIGEVTDYFGNIIDTYYAEFDAVVLYNTVAFSVKKDTSIIAYGQVNN